MRFLASDDAGSSRAPQEIESAAEKMIGEIIARGDGGEGAANEAGVLLWKSRFHDEVASEFGRARARNRSRAHERIRTSKGLPMRS